MIKASTTTARYDDGTVSGYFTRVSDGKRNVVGAWKYGNETILFGVDEENGDVCFDIYGPVALYRIDRNNVPAVIAAVEAAAIEAASRIWKNASK